MKQPVQRASSTRKSVSRVPAKPLLGRGARMPAYDHPALMEGRTLYPTTVRPEAQVRSALKPGRYSSKIGDVVLKGRWKGLRVYTLTLEERATCPASCRHWRSCYGNNVHLGERLVSGPALERRLETELDELARLHSRFVVRLHILGDFYRLEYVALWARMLKRHPGLNIFGYTARIDEGDPIARAVADLVRNEWDRFAVRFSNGASHECTTISVEHPFQVPPDAILCPAQIGRTESCTTCGLCWQTKARVAFLQH